MVPFSFKCIEFAVSVYPLGLEDQVFKAGIGSADQSFLVVLILDPGRLNPHLLSLLLPRQNWQPFLLIGFKVVNGLPLAEHSFDHIGIILPYSHPALLGGL